MTLGQLIKDFRDKQHMSMQAFASASGMSKAYISILERNVNPKTGRPPVPSLETIQAVGRVIGVGFNDLIAMLDRNQEVDISGAGAGWPDNIRPMPKLREVPRIGSIACGVPILAEQNLEGYDRVPDWVKCDFTLVCKGDSMINARIHDGDIVCIKIQPEVENGQIAAVQVEGEFDSEATLKRVRYISGGVVLWPENPIYEPMSFMGQDVNKVRILGLATHFLSKVT